MAKRAFEMMMAGLEDAIAYAQGDESRGRRHQFDVAGIRARTKKTQAQFAKDYHLPIGTVRDWEQGRTIPEAPARTLLAIIDADPEAVAKLVRKAEKMA